MSTSQNPSTSVHFLSLGCPKNRIDTETMLANLTGDYSVEASPENADVIVVNTCAFVESAKQESINAILEMADYKTEGKAQKLIVSGCLSQRYSTELSEALPEVDHFIGTSDLEAVKEILDQESQHTQTPERIWVSNPDRQDFNWELPRVNTMSSHSTYLKIAEGCSNKCAFCIIPKLRGPQRSRSIESIVREAEELATQGIVELNLIAQDLTAYGYDLKPRTNLTALLKALEEVEGIQWIRLFYAYPRSFPSGLIEFMSQSKKVVPYLDMPLQHISDSVLRLMKRATSSATIRRRIRELRETLPHLVIRTSFIVGYPGETEEDHQQLLAFLKEARFDRVGAFKYSLEEGTDSYEIDPNLRVTQEVMDRRYDELMFTQREISRELNEALIGKEVDVLIERTSEESDLAVMGRTAQQAPEIDGVTYLGLDEDLERGQIIRGIITQVTDYDLAVERIN